VTRTRLVTPIVLVVIVVLIVVALFREAASGPTFRAEDHASYEACIRNIPADWAPGSLERTGAEDACAYVHRRSPAADRSPGSIARAASRPDRNPEAVRAERRVSAS
jgi:hypothetical protein